LMPFHGTSSQRFMRPRAASSLALPLREHSGVAGRAEPAIGRVKRGVVAALVRALVDGDGDRAFSC
jgi:hypothetical protein